MIVIAGNRVTAERTFHLLQSKNIFSIRVNRHMRIIFHIIVD